MYYNDRYRKQHRKVREDKMFTEGQHMSLVQRQKGGFYDNTYTGKSN